MKKTKIIIPALGMLLLSTAASVTGTVAWFSMNNFVNATNMNITAKAENGIVISNEAQSTWTNSAEASHKAAIAVRPTSTKDASTWCHSTSNDANDENTNNPYTMITPVLDTTSGAGYLDDNGTDGYQSTGETADSNYYLLNSFYIKSSAEAITKTIYVTNVEVSNGNSPTSANLDRALRVLIKSGTSVLVYAPFEGATLSYNVCTAVNAGTPSKQAVTAIYPNQVATTGNPANPGKDVVLLSNHSIPAFTVTDPEAPQSVKIDVYLYFEGEDENCISANLSTTLDNINVSVRFGTAQEYSHANVA